MRPAALFAAALTVLVAFAFGPRPAGAQAAAPPDSLGARIRLRLYLDCPDARLDTDFLKRELAWVDWVRDRADADVIVLLTLRGTGSGGNEATFYVTRPRGGGPASDTLRAFSPPAASDDDSRRLIARTLAAALARDMVGRPEGDHLHVTVDAPPHPAATATKDRWKHWVYSISTNGYLNGEQSYQQYYANGSLTASRVTEGSKLGARLGENYNQAHYEFGDGSQYTSITRGWNGRAIAVKSLAPRWSAGTSVNAWSSTYSNIDLSVGVGPAIEFDVFPYAESSRRSLTFAWQLYGGYSDYAEETLFLKQTENFVLQEVDVAFARREAWGSIVVSSSLHEYLHDLSLYSLGVNGSIGLKIFRGFSLDLNGNAVRVHDQISLPRGDASDSEVLVRQRQLATSYSYWMSFGVSYRFGSIFNNAVNTRLENTLGSM
jgi:hypothetical protein